MMRWMKEWNRTRTWIAGLLLIVAANAAALIGVAVNRSGEPDSTLRLSQRELRVPYNWRAGAENTGVALSIEWQALSMDEDYEKNYGYTTRSPGWLNEAKLAELGFEVPTESKRVHYRQQTKEVLLVLEFDGPARRRALEQAQKRLTDAEQLLAANPDKKEFDSRVKSARKTLENEALKNSRLFAIDAGLDRDALRARYPDRTRYAILRACIRPHVTRSGTNKPERLAAYISALSVDRVNVPHGLQQLIGPRRGDGGRNQEDRAYEFEVAFGGKLEPWIISGNAGQAAGTVGR